MYWCKGLAKFRKILWVVFSLRWKVHFCTRAKTNKHPSNKQKIEYSMIKYNMHLSLSLHFSLYSLFRLTLTLILACSFSVMSGIWARTFGLKIEARGWWSLRYKMPMDHVFWPGASCTSHTLIRIINIYIHRSKSIMHNEWSLSFANEWTPEYLTYRRRSNHAALKK